MKSTALKKRMPLRAKTPLKRASGISQRSDRQAVESKEWNDTVGTLISQVGCCEICGGAWRLQGHHIIWRSRWTRKLAERWGLMDSDKNTKKNCLIACILCHSHDKYPQSGLPITIEQALEIARKRSGWQI